MFKKILAAVDGSTHSDRAVQAAAELAACTGAGLLICHVFYIPEHYRSDLIGELRAAIRKDGEDILAHAVRVAKQSGLEAESRLLEEGHPAEAIIRLAGEESADLIVVGATGESRVRGLLMGSTAFGVIQRSPVPVLVVPPPA